MDLSIRDWMFVIGVLLVLAVMLDGYRRAQRARRNQVRLSKNAKRMSKRSVEETSRTQVQDDFADVEPGRCPFGFDQQDDETSPPLNNQDLGLGEVRSTDTQDDLDPLFVDPIKASKQDDVGLESTFTAPSFSAVDSPSILNEEETQILQTARDELNAEYEEQASPEAVAPTQAQTQTSSDKVSAKKKSSQDRAEFQPSLFDAPAEEPEVEEIVVLNVLANDKAGFSGADLFHILLACDCRFGDMNIFHRYEEQAGRKLTQFSVVNMVKPGTFNMDDAESFSTPGVSFFVRLPGPGNPLEAFDAMVETAQCVVRNLNGQLKDADHSTATEQTLAHSRERIREFEQKRLLRA